MGCQLIKPVRNPNSVVPEANQVSTAIDRQLLEDQLKSKLDYKLLLLGAGESGKSTVVKQLQMLYAGRVTMKSSQEFAKILQTNAVSNAKHLVKGVLDDRVELTPEIREIVQRIDGLHPQADEFNEKIAMDISKLWEDPTIRKVYDQPHKFYISESAQYCFENATRFASPDFVPSRMDVIMARIRTTGMLLTEFEEGPVHWRIVDVGGQRSERKKWIGFMDNVCAILYVVDLAAYNNVLFEDASENAMVDALNLFENTINHKAFSGAEIFLFMNKKDLFARKIQEAGIKTVFEEYKGSGEVDDSIEFIANKFQQKSKNGLKIAKVFSGSALSADRVREVFDEIRDYLQSRDRFEIRTAIRDINRAHNL